MIWVERQIHRVEPITHGKRLKSGECYDAHTVTRGGTLRKQYVDSRRQRATVNDMHDTENMWILDLGA